MKTAEQTLEDTLREYGEELSKSQKTAVIAAMQEYVIDKLTQPRIY